MRIIGPRPHFAVACCMRDEAMFVLEWVAHQRLIGFETVFVITNDCTDGTDLICDAIAETDPNFVHIRNQVLTGEAPQIAGMKRVFAHPRLMSIDYLLHCDADEFLNISCGDGRVEDIIRALGQHDCIALAWRPFGDAGLKKWTGGLVTDLCQMSVGRVRPAFTVHKSLFQPSKFGWATDHMPKMPKSKVVSLVNSRGENMPANSLFNPQHARFRGTRNELITWDNACIHHYAIRSEDVFLMKNKRGDGMSRQTDRYHLNSKFWRRNNVNRKEVPLPPTYLENLKKEVFRLQTIPKVREIELQAISDFQRARDEFLTPAMIKQLTIQ